MITKLIVYIAAILVFLMSLFVILKVNFEDNVNNSISDIDKFVGKWRLIYTPMDESNNEIPDTSEESDNFVNYETYEFLSNGSYYHVVDEDNSSGDWKINNSILVLTVYNQFDDLPLYYEYVFSGDNNKVTLNLFNDSEYYYEFEKIII